MTASRPLRLGTRGSELALWQSNHVAARIAALAGPGEVLASRTVRDLAAGSGIDFRSTGSHSLKGVADDWEVFGVEATSLSAGLQQ
jgi:class 3 adenylate cyclase